MFAAATRDLGETGSRSSRTRCPSHTRTLTVPRCIVVSDAGARHAQAPGGECPSRDQMVQEDALDPLDAARHPQRAE